MLMDYSDNNRWSDPLRVMRQAQEEVNRLLGGLGGLGLATDTEFPPVNVWTGADGALVTAEVPGISPDQIEITVHRDTVTLRGKRETETFGDNATVLRQERPSGDFARSVVLPFRVDPDKVAARFERGIVVLELPRPEADKPRHIKVMHA
ncbi:MAG TPA: Hsp20/alpha crystallin family protein [Alphaproteobacteria bacterium]